MQSVTHITNPHPSLEHRSILTIQFSGFALMFISIYAITKPSVLQAPMPNSDTISNPKEKFVFTKGISQGIPNYSLEQAPSASVSCFSSLALSPGILFILPILFFFNHLGMSICFPVWERMGVHLGRWRVREDLRGVGGRESMTSMYCMQKHFSVKIFQASWKWNNRHIAMIPNFCRLGAKCKIVK